MLPRPDQHVEMPAPSNEERDLSGDPVPSVGPRAPVLPGPGQPLDGPDKALNLELLPDGTRYRGTN